MQFPKIAPHRKRLATVSKATTALLASAVLVGCGGGGSDSSLTASLTTASTGTTGVLCDYSSSSFNSSPSVNATATATWSCSGTRRSLIANGLPDHEVGSFPNRNNPNPIAAQSISVSSPLSPALSSMVTALGGPRGDTGFVLNGVKIDPGTAGSCNDSGASCSLIGNSGQWSIEALGQASFNFGVDGNNAHVQPGGAYHYHGMPEGFINKLGKGQAMTLVGWAADGFPIYARYGYSVATDANSALKVIKGSYRLKATPPATRPPTSLYALGTFQQDYEYIAGSGDLDECNGRSGVTPEFP
ncbi:MAG: YHYH protein, partial [Betaproteobacteria bacterium]|nr:YHYH protein [Betaproteobacteria bacterium]